MLNIYKYEHQIPIRPEAARIVPAVIPTENRPQGRPGGVNATAVTEIRGSAADLAPAWPSIDRPLPGGHPMSSAQATAGPSPASLVFLEFEQGGGI
jgi:hypothetical protein